MTTAAPDRKHAQTQLAAIAGQELEYLLLPGDTGPAPLVFLHEGLGSISMWRDFPHKVAAATGRRTLVYARRGYGRSEPVAAPRGVDYMHREGLEVLPAVLDHFGFDRPILLGHSDGASIALIYAGGTGRGVEALILEAPHVFVEDLTVESIAKVKDVYAQTNLREKLARHHADVDGAFWGWNNIWLHPDFRQWNIEAYLPQVSAPTLVIQGADDEYGTLAQVEAIERQAAGSVARVVLPDCGHSPHRDQEAATLAAVADFVAVQGGQAEARQA